MDSIIQVSGLVNFSITIDPTVWIFDDRKQTADTVFEPIEVKDDLEAYTKEAAKHWDQEITEGAKIPDQSKKSYKKVEMLTGTFYMPLAPFIKNAGPKEAATTLTITSNDGEYTIPLQEIDSIFLLFCVKGKPLTEDGPVHIYDNKKAKEQTPIKNIKAFKIT
ncbi:peptidyl-prolyl cis-trans isomerase [Niallia sp.]|uniref:peptidyl-prolyl cis-trans isomerase n=1 Tax=Niallia sp. TaxID=2837523 RepID=UPI002899046A|nr:peptidyl-prolyl cis-trans isomerase [Niallia sp.]